MPLMFVYVIHKVRFQIGRFLVTDVGGLWGCKIGITEWRRQLGWSHGVMVSTLDFESSDPSSNLGGTFCFYMR